MLNDYRQIISALRNSAWMILPESLDMILEIVNMRLQGKAFSDEEIRIRLQEAESESRDNSRVQIAQGIGIIPLYGPIFPKANLMTELSGATSLEAFSNDLQMLVNDDTVETIVLDVDSPGGVSDMMPETSQKIREAREIKPVYAVANTMAASAAYMLASQATKMYATPSGKVGSVGTYVVHEDFSKRNENEGRKVTYISAGRLKTAGNEDEPLTGEAKEYIQGIVNEAQRGFVEQVALGRGISVEDVEANFGEGGVVLPAQALAAGMIDDVRSLEDVVGSLLVESQPQVQGTLATVLAKHQKALEVASKSGIKPIKQVAKEGRMNEQELRKLLGISDDGNLEQSVQTLLAADKENRETRSKLGLAQDASITETVSKMQDDLKPVREAEGLATKQQAFAEAFPEEYKEMQSLREKRVEDSAQQFADGYERFSKQDGDKQVKSHLGFPMVTLNKIGDCHKAISNREFTHEMLKNLLDLVTQQGFVDFSEHGSSRKGEVQVDDPILQFSNRITTIVTEDKIGVSQATRMAIERYPEEYKAYREAQSAKSKTTA